VDAPGFRTLVRKYQPVNTSDHTETADSDGALGHPVVQAWMHCEFLTLADAKRAKSAGYIIRVSELPEKGFQPLDFRYLRRHPARPLAARSTSPPSR